MIGFEGHRTGEFDDPRCRLTQVLERVRIMVAQEGNDFAWSRWSGRDEAMAELDGLIKRVALGAAPMHEVARLFDPTGPLHELSLSSGWSDAFISFSDQVDRILERTN